MTANFGLGSEHSLRPTRARRLEDLNVEDYGDEESFARDNVTLFKAIAEASGKDYIVDSSKHPARLDASIAKSCS